MKWAQFGLNHTLALVNVRYAHVAFVCLWAVEAVTGDQHEVMSQEGD
jgi:hypothetical protein